MGGSGWKDRRKEGRKEEWMLEVEGRHERRRNLKTGRKEGT